MSKEESKPCPFCGGEAKVDRAFYDYMKYWVECTSCKAAVYNKEPDDDNPAQALAAWNKRHLCKDHEFVCNTCDHKCGIEVIEREGKG